MAGVGGLATSGEVDAEHEKGVACGVGVRDGYAAASFATLDCRVDGHRHRQQEHGHRARSDPASSNAFAACT
jgi:hypothetical protein